MADDRARVLIVDDIEVNRIILDEILSDTYETEQADNGLAAISLMMNAIDKPDILLLDIMMPEMNGFEVLEFMKGDPTLAKIPVIFITAADDEVKGLKAGAVDYISKPFKPEIVQLRVASQIELYLYRNRLEGLVEAKANELTETKERFIATIADLIEYRSLETGHHVKHTRELARIFVRLLLKEGPYGESLMSEGHQQLISAVPIHDIGKMGVPDNILLKPGKLTPEEFKVIETHTVIGSNVIKSLDLTGDDPYLRHCYDITRHHHERWDGNGYPDKLAAEEIPISARITAIVDVYDALVSERCYKKAFTHDEAKRIIGESAGSHFDPYLVEVFLANDLEFKECRSKL